MSARFWKGWWWTNALEGYCQGRKTEFARWKAEDGVGRCFEISSDGTLAPALLLSPGL